MRQFSVRLRLYVATVTIFRYKHITGWQGR